MGDDPHSQFMYDPGSSGLRTALAVVLLVIGAVWILQGLNVEFAPDSFMTGEVEWVLFGVTSVLSGVTILWRQRKSG